MGIETAIIGSAILGAGASMAGASRSASAARDATAAQTAAANQQLALNREIYYDQRGLQQPYLQAGYQALYGNSGLMNLLGHAGGSTQAGTAAPANAFASGTYGTGTIGAPQSGPDWDAYLQANPDVAQSFAQAVRTPHLRNLGITTPQQYAEYHYNTHGRGEGRQLPQYQQQQASPQPVGSPSKDVDVNGGVRSGDQDASGSQIGPMTATLRETPGYQFLQDEAKRGVENSFAARGKLLSGGAMDALNTRTLGIADQTYQSAVNNQFNLANIGMGAAAQIGGAGQSYANGAGNAFANIGNAQANGAIGQANAFNAGLQGVYGSAMGGLGMYGSYKGWGG
jgi:hypothetical protein